MKIIKKSPLTGIETTLELNITEHDFQRWLNGELIQKVFPKLSPDEREFILTGYTPEDWNKLFPPEKGEE